MRLHSVFARLVTVALSLASPRLSSTVVAMDPAARARIVASGRVGDDVVDALDRGDRARVMITFSASGAPPAGSRRGADRARRRSAIAATRTRIVATMDARDFTLRRSFDTIEAVAGDITTAGLLRLLDDPSVVRVDLDGGGGARMLPDRDLYPEDFRSKANQQRLCDVGPSRPGCYAVQ